MIAIGVIDFSAKLPDLLDATGRERMEGPLGGEKATSEVAPNEEDRTTELDGSISSYGEGDDETTEAAASVANGEASTDTITNNMEPSSKKRKASQSILDEETVSGEEATAIVNKKSKDDESSSSSVAGSKTISNVGMSSVTSRLSNLILPPLTTTAMKEVVTVDANEYFEEHRIYFHTKAVYEIMDLPNLDKRKKKVIDIKYVKHCHQQFLLDDENEACMAEEEGDEGDENEEVESEGNTDHEYDFYNNRNQIRNYLKMNLGALSGIEKNKKREKTELEAEIERLDPCLTAESVQNELSSKEITVCLPSFERVTSLIVVASCTIPPTCVCLHCCRRMNESGSTKDVDWFPNWWKRNPKHCLSSRHCSCLRSRNYACFRTANAKSRESSRKSIRQN